MLSRGGVVVGWCDPVPLHDALLCLGRLGRWCGHTLSWWTVLQHSLLCHRIAELWLEGAPELRETFPHLPVQCLLHDWAETLINDIPKPFKPPQWEPLERQHVELTAQVYGLGHMRWGGAVWEAIKSVDEGAAHAEGDALRLDRWSPGVAERAAMGDVRAIPHDANGGATHKRALEIIQAAQRGAAGGTHG